MSEVNGVVKALVVLLLAGLMSLFVAQAIDLAIPAAVDPYASDMMTPVPPAKEAEFDAARAENAAKLERGEITQAQADQRSVVIDEQQMAYFEGISEPYARASAVRSLIVSLVSMALVTLFLAAGVVMMQRGAALGAVPLMAGAFLAIYAVGMGAQSDATWVRIVVAGAVAAGAAGAGLRVFRRAPRSA